MLISILIPCFNAERWIAQAIQSALEQEVPEKEVIVVDDGSIDGSLDIIRSFGDAVRWETGPNRGGNITRNRLLRLSRGEWLQYLDADDYLLPGKVARQAEFMCSNPKVDVIYSPTLCEKIVNNKPSLVKEPIPEPHHDPWVLLALWHLPQTSGPLFKRKAIEDAGGWRDGQPCCQEHELYFRLLATGKRFAFFNDNSAVYRNWNFGTRLTGSVGEAIHKQRIIILNRMESFLVKHAALIPARRQAINDARHQIARTKWHYDRRFAHELIGQIERSDPSFSPSRGPACSGAYRACYRLTGFTGAEWIGELARKLAIRRHQGPAEGLLSNNL